MIALKLATLTLVIFCVFAETNNAGITHGTRTCRRRLFWKKITITYTPHKNHINGKSNKWQQRYTSSALINYVNRSNNCYRKIANKIMMKNTVYINDENSKGANFKADTASMLSHVGFKVGKENDQKLFGRAFDRELKKVCEAYKNDNIIMPASMINLAGWFYDRMVIPKPQTTLQAPKSKRHRDNDYNELRRNADKFLRNITTALDKTVKNDLWEKNLKSLLNNAFTGRWSAKMRRQFAADARASRPIIHGDMVKLLQDWLIIKRAEGSWIEKKVYKHMDHTGLLDRLVTKRSVAFLGKTDTTLLRDGSRYMDWSNVGKENDTKHLYDYLSYDEMQLSALIGISSAVQIMNDGGRYNNGRNTSGAHVTNAIYIGLVGCRWERKAHDQMEWQHMVADENRKYGDYPTLEAFEKYYGVPPGTMTGQRSHNAKDTDFPKNKKGQYLLPEVMRSRFKKTAELHLFEAQARGLHSKKKVRAVTVGLGLGVWLDDIVNEGVCKDKLVPTKMYIRAWLSAIEEHANKLSTITTVEFNYGFRLAVHWMAVQKELTGHTDWKMDETTLKISFRLIAAPKIKIVFTSQLDEEKGKQATGPKSARHGRPFAIDSRKFKELIVANFAYDSNAAPGNEYWLGNLSGSGDPAAACCSTIPWLMNSEVNKFKINGRSAAAFDIRDGKEREVTKYYFPGSKVKSVPKSSDRKCGEKYMQHHNMSLYNVGRSY